MSRSDYVTPAETREKMSAAMKRVVADPRQRAAYTARLAAGSGNFFAVRDPKFIATARRLWATGLSARLIGQRMGVTKNVIIGLANRNNFTARSSPLPRRAP
tara:strand:- start:131 stop:436 length:306 start_codon:yes stop_codon:yes gene_type:complete